MDRFILPATDIKVDDRLDMAGRSRVAAVHTHNGRVLARVTRRGARTASIRAWKPTDSLTIWRKVS